MSACTNRDVEDGSTFEDAKEKSNIQVGHMGTELLDQRPGLSPSGASCFDMFRLLLSHLVHRHLV